MPQEIWDLFGEEFSEHFVEDGYTKWTVDAYGEPVKPVDDWLKSQGADAGERIVIYHG